MRCRSADGGGADAPADGQRACDTGCHVLEEVRCQTDRFLAGLSRPPSVLRIRVGEVSLSVEWATSPEGPAPVVQPEAEASGPEKHHVSAPSVGVFYEAPEPGAEPFVHVDDVVERGQQLAVVETMKLLISVEADRAGKVVEVLRKNGDSVEYGEPLFVISPLTGDGTASVP